MSKPETALKEVFFPVRDYDLAATVTSGQAFRWVFRDGAWEGVIAEHWVQLREGIHARAGVPVRDWSWLRDYLQVDVDLDAILLSFPDDEPMRESVLACRGLRLLRQDPWECLASFILSSTKQIVQIQQIIALLCERLGKPLLVPAGHPPVFSFPTAERLAACAEPDLRACKMGFRAPNLLRTAKIIAAGDLNLESLRLRSTAEARAELINLPGVGQKIADCILLFAYGFQDAFPVDVWVMKALRELYFAKRRPTLRKLREFADTHFGANAGYAQQYLFHYARTKARIGSRRRSPHH